MDRVKIWTYINRGNGLGKNEDGRRECLQLKRRPENAGVKYNCVI